MAHRITTGERSFALTTNEFYALKHIRQGIDACLEVRPRARETLQTLGLITEEGGRWVATPAGMAAHGCGLVHLRQIYVNGGKDPFACKVCGSTWFSKVIEPETRVLRYGCDACERRALEQEK